MTWKMPIPEPLSIEQQRRLEELERLRLPTPDEVRELIDLDAQAHGHEVWSAMPDEVLRRVEEAGERWVRVLQDAPVPRDPRLVRRENKAFEAAMHDATHPLEVE